MSAAVAKPDAWASWKAEITGKPRDLPRGVAAQGFYEVKTQQGHQALAVWLDDDGDMIARLGTGEDVLADEDFCERIFSRSRAIPHGTYQRVVEGKGWPDEVGKSAPAAADEIAQNPENPHADQRNTEAAEHELILKEIDLLEIEAEAWLAGIGGKVADQAQADKAANYKTAFADLQKKAEAGKKVAKAPVLDEADRLEKLWKPVIAAGSVAKNWAVDLTDEFLRAERARKLAEAAAKATEGKTVRTEDTKVKAGIGRGVSLTTVTTLVVDDPDVLWAHLAGLKAFRENRVIEPAAMALATNVLRAGYPVPGAHLETEQKPR
jgi:hypothetical protein